MVKLSSALIISTAVLSSVTPVLSLYVPRSDSSNNDALEVRDTREVFDGYVINKLTDRELQEREPFLPVLGYFAVKWGAKIALKVGKKIAAKVVGHYFNKIGKRSIDELEIDAPLIREMGEIVAILEGREPTVLFAELNEREDSATEKVTKEANNRKPLTRVAYRKGKYVEESGLDKPQIELERDFEIDGLD